MIDERINIEMRLIHGTVLVAVEERCNGVYFFCFFASFWNEDSLSPELDEGVFTLRWVEEQEIEVHRYAQYIIQSSVSEPHKGIAHHELQIMRQKLQKRQIGWALLQWNFLNRHISFYC